MKDLINNEIFYIEGKSIETEKKHTENEKLILFEVNKNYFGVTPETIKEITGNYYITKIPYVKNFILGLINLRNEIISVVDLSAF
jgi:chemotaxis signal transduction protein